MVNEVFEDDQEFYHEDFSTASDFEAFCVSLGEILENLEQSGICNKEPLTKNQLSLVDWSEETELITFNDLNLAVTRHRCDIKAAADADESVNVVFQDLMSIENGFNLYDVSTRDEHDSGRKSSQVHPLAIFYGLRDFIVIRSKSRILNDISLISLLKSALNLALNDSRCKIPTFIQIMHPDQNVYSGVFDAGEQRVMFDICHLKTPPPSCKFLSGLLDMFKGKLENSSSTQAASVSVRLSFSLKNFTSFSYSTEKCSGTDDWDVVDFLGTISSLPFGVSADPVKEIMFYAKWPQVAENVVFDSETYSDFNPMNAPKWSLKTKFDTSLVTHLSDTLHEYLTLSESPEHLSEYYYLTRMKNQSRESERNPFSGLTDSKIPSLPNMFDYDSYTIDGPISEEQMRSLIEFLLPSGGKHRYEMAEGDKVDYKIKSSPQGSIISRLTTIIANVYTFFGGRRGVAQFWIEFANQIRHRFEKNTKIPGVAKGYPDMRTCLLHQKLQILNVCIDRKLLQQSTTGGQVVDSNERNDSDDEFYDCDEDEQQQQNIVNDEGDENSRFQSPWTAVGRLQKLGTMMLIESDEPLYIPITQDPVPKTEDELEDDAEMLLSVADGELRAQLLSASLLSDMESFKAANPKAKLEDFIRWYSPRDWIQENNTATDPTGRAGQLSERMKIEGNTWISTWNSAKPVPARRQKRLFDDTKEAQKVLHFLDQQSLGSIGQLTIASLFHSGLDKLAKEAEYVWIFIPKYDELYQKLRQSVCSMSREKWIETKSFSKKKWEQIVNEIAELELNINQIKSIALKLSMESSMDRDLLNSLMKSHETDLDEDLKNIVGAQLIKLFKEAAVDQNEAFEESSTFFPNATEKQFVLRMSGIATQDSAGGPSFLRAIITNQDFRLCGAFSRNISFLLDN